MHSFTSSSSLRRSIVMLGFFCFGLGVAAFCCEIELRYIQALWGERLKVRHAPPVQFSSAHYSTPWNDALFYIHDIGLVYSDIKECDILLLGNSRMLYAVRDRNLLDWRHDGLTAYNLAFMGERYTIAEYLIKRHDIRPALVVVNTDYWFTSGMRLDTEKAVKLDSWGARRDWFEARFGWEFKRRLHRYVPHFSVPKVTFPFTVVFYRAHKTGGLIPVLPSSSTAPINQRVRSSKPTAESITYARNFVNYIESRGGRVLFTLVPYNDADLVRSRALARTVGVPFFEPDPSQLSIGWADHLNEQGANVFSGLLADYLRTHRLTPFMNTSDFAGVTESID